MTYATWDQVARKEQPTWFLDPLVARQKREKNLALVRPWIEAGRGKTVLKTDLFEEANGEDDLLPELAHGNRVIAMDVSAVTASRARKRYSIDAALFLATDVRHVGLASESVDQVVSNSTLDLRPVRNCWKGSLR